MGIRINDLPSSLRPAGLKIVKEKLRKTCKFAKLNRSYSFLDSETTIGAFVGIFQIFALIVVVVSGLFSLNPDGRAQGSLPILYTSTLLAMPLVLARIYAYAYDHRHIRKTVNGDYELGIGELGKLIDDVEQRLKKQREPLDKQIDGHLKQFEKERLWLEGILSKGLSDDLSLNTQYGYANRLLPAVLDAIKQFNEQKERLEACFSEPNAVLAELKRWFDDQSRLNSTAELVKHLDEAREALPGISEKITDLEGKCVLATLGLTDIAENVQAINKACREMDVNERGEPLNLNH